ncbi:TetR/AcrR family transcriptional regulator [Streptomyces gobiensis]|uniref:TetR/AcrR family transcriptional regulator n=1 Tax=Streptomyces gobiensis TaxID=2875706 RepID=UPI001E60D285|nr:TetR/AcrR family transcriptional regulator [Streptomyces gobiensis]UGY94123.1 TetR/AcrR family transcriptional regulator [Streptomyces gobiensis]
MVVLNSHIPHSRRCGAADSKTGVHFMAIATGEIYASPSGQSTRRRLEVVAAELFYRQGYTKTSVREILSALGMTPGAMYNHFRSKEELLYSIASRNHAELEEQLSAALGRGGGDPPAQLWEAAQAVTVFCTMYRMEAIVSRSEVQHLPAAQANEMLESERRVRRGFERVLEKGREKEIFRIFLPDGRPADIPVTAKAILDLCINAGLWFRPEGRLSAEDIATQYGVLALQAAGVTPAEVQSVVARVPR